MLIKQSSLVIKDLAYEAKAKTFFWGHYTVQG